MYCQSVRHFVKIEKMGKQVLIGVATALFTIIINLSYYSVLLQYSRAQRGDSVKGSPSCSTDSHPVVNSTVK